MLARLQVTEDASGQSKHGPDGASSGNAQPSIMPAALPRQELQPCACDLHGLLSKLPSKLFETIDVRAFAEVLQSHGAQRLILQRGHSMQVALATGWMPASHLPEATVSEQDLAAVAQNLGLQVADATSIKVVPGMLHRASFGYCCSSLDSVVLHVTRLLPGVSSAIQPQRLQDSVLLLGSSSSGKSTVLRDLVSSLTFKYQVVIVDFMAELSACGFHPARTVVPAESSAPVAFVQKVIQEQCPEVLVAEFLDAAVAIQCAKLCNGAGIQLVASLRGSLADLVDSFLSFDKGVPACYSFPFVTVVALNRNLDALRIFSPFGATACAMVAGRRPCCLAHHVPNSPSLRPKVVVPLKRLQSQPG